VRELKKRNRLLEQENEVLRRAGDCATRGKLLFRAGQVAKYVAVPIYSRATNADSAFTMRLRAPEGAPIAKRVGRGGIVR